MAMVPFEQLADAAGANLAQRHPVSVSLQGCFSPNPMAIRVPTRRWNATASWLPLSSVPQSSKNAYPTPRFLREFVKTSLKIREIG
jgi:hypothetical protein